MADSPGVHRRRRLSDESRREGTEGSGAGKEDSGRKRKRRILSCDTCRRQKCRCELDDESEACARCRSLRFRSLEASIEDLKATIQSLASGSRPEMRRTLAAVGQERHQSKQPQQQQQQQQTTDMDGNEAGEASRVRGNEDVEPADRHVYSSPAEVVRKVGSQLSGGYRRTFDVQADVVSLGILDEKAARNLVTEFVLRRKHTLLMNSEVDLAPHNRDLRLASPFLHDACCLHAMRFSEHSSSGLHRRVFEHVRLQLGQLMIASPLPLEELTGILIMSLWASSPSSPEYIDSWLLSGHCAQQAMLSINFSEILSRTKSRTATEEDQRVMRLWANTCLAASDQDSLSSSPRLNPVDAGPAASNGNQSTDAMHARVITFATDVVRAFVDMPSSRAEELPEFHRLCVAYAMLIISKYENKPPGVAQSDADVLELLRSAQRHNGVTGNSAPSAIQFGLERALKKVATRVEGRTGGFEVSALRGGVGQDAAPAAGWTPTTTPMTAATQQQQQGMGGHQDHSSTFTGTTFVPDFDGSSLALETMDFFFSGGHLGLGDQSFF
ncbi:Transcriptional activator of proteases prtT 3 [Colletotrichum chlorophyti]|uniref:Transcriptional activator of proteases prtT n=1 Tax=Colletotrichum chlorophyti TaxID=708187 RepID=A0A1Q8S391_9PEZI|nr:Transcriptional activator of proteases prtT 3 [Colletotrichum chlorophyti]